MPTFDFPGDIMLTPGGTSIMLASGASRVKQRLKVGIETILGTYKYDPSKGLPWFDWLDRTQRVVIETELRKFFLSYPEVLTIVNLALTVTKATRQLSVRYELKLKSAELITDTIAIAQVNT
jgi:hypothetical protein